MTKPAFKPQKILWVDLEMSGLFPREDLILEIAAIVTDWDFTEIGTYEAVVKQDATFLQKRMQIDFWQENSVARDQLLTQNKDGKSLKVVEKELQKFVNRHIGRDEKVLLAGNSIHQDRQFIDFWWPDFAIKLHYRMLDVSAWKVVFEGRYHKKFAKPEAHRALSDIRGSIEELKYYLKKVKL
ncbi:oligoribonuclease [Candidatus Saccharibacteria bacterium]|nr:oligoribonuclease [Candidatus Saccharibacteria bacterium]NCU40757.1 oligoribonuclease [Candidatus Saccharibacteria bacterium]